MSHPLKTDPRLLADTPPPQVELVEELIKALKATVHSSNAHTATAALLILPALFDKLVPDHPEPDSADLRRAPSTSSSVATSAPAYSPTTIHHLKLAFVALLPLERIGDTKERTRELAREVLVSAGRAALRLGVKAGSAVVGGKEKEGPWAYLARMVEEGGFRSKNAKAREQVSPPPRHPPRPCAN